MTEFLPHLILMLVGGLAASLGLGQFARGRRGRALLEGRPGWHLAVFAIVGLALMGAAGYWMVRRVLDADGTTNPFGPPWTLLLVGLAVGLPMSLPQVIAVWSGLRPEKVAAREAKAAAATREDREEYAETLLGQIREAAPEPRTLEAFVRGEDGRVLWFEGDLARDEGERLVAALRQDLSEVGFRRVEARGGRGNWWTNV